ncbi:MAG TPA: hypothetical protein VMF11_12525 [Candidatus Baltobacteraceae bacterium]|nr:hypothetical protein [Candidatus Baltobacteraceae bacterium]
MLGLLNNTSIVAPKGGKQTAWLVRFPPMRHRLLPLFGLAAGLIPAAAGAAPISISPPSVNLRVGESVVIRASADNERFPVHLTIVSSTCFTGAGSARDILKPISVKVTDSPGEWEEIRLEVRAQHPGRCEIKFESSSKSGSNVKAVDVNVKAQQP